MTNLSFFGRRLASEDAGATSPRSEKKKRRTEM
jgi:hypothetical protein